MIAAILFVATQTQQGMFAAMFPMPTGMNGLEDYVLAKDVMDQGYWSAYSGWAPPENEVSPRRRIELGPDGLEGIPDPKLVEKQRHLGELCLLEVREEEESNFAKSLQLVLSGNTKACEVQTSTNGVHVPTVSIFSSLGSLERDVAYVQASRSHTDQMISDLENVLVMVDHGCRTTYVGSIVATVAQMRVCAMFAENLDRLSLPDTDAIELLVNKFFLGTPVFIDAYRAAFLSEQKSVAEPIHDLKALVQNSTKDKQVLAFLAVMKDMSNPEVDQLVQRVQQNIGANARTFLAKFSQPERTWLGSDNSDDENSPDPVIRTPEDIESYFSLHWSVPYVTQTRRVTEALRVRAMMRLLRLHAKIIAFRWEHDRLPSSFTEMNLPAEYLYDPLSDAQFVYQPSGENYKLFSLGSKATGKIELGVAGGGSQSIPEINP